jgi:hypothetical protein
LHALKNHQQKSLDITILQLLFLFEVNGLGYLSADSSLN